MTTTGSNTDLYDSASHSLLMDRQPTVESNQKDKYSEPSPIRSARSSWRAEKRCWVCFGTDESSDVVNEVWLHPCKCRGSAKWVHEYCLQRWVDEKQKDNLNLEVRCSQCNMPYKMIFPKVGPLACILSKIDTWTSKISPLLGTAMLASALHWEATCLGAITVINIYGVRRGVALLRDQPPILLFLTLPVIPICLLTCQVTRWRTRTAHWLYRKFHPADTAQLRVIVPTDAAGARSLFRDLFITLLYPSIAVRIARSIFPNQYDQNPLKYASIGGLIYSGVHAMFSIYYRYIQVYRGENRKIANNNDFDQGRLYFNNEGRLVFEQNFDVDSDDQEDDDDFDDGNGREIIEHVEEFEDMLENL